MGAFLQWFDTAGNAQTLSFDVVEKENPNFPTEVTEYAVEKGANVADNVRVGTKSIELNVFVSNEPILTNPMFGQGQNAAQALQTPATNQPPLVPTVLTQATWFTLPFGVPILGALVAHEVDVPFAPQVGLQPKLSDTVSPTVLTFPSFFDAVKQTHDLLDQLRTNVQILTVFGTKGTYDNFVVEKFEMVRDKTTGTGARFNIDLKELRLVTTLVVKAPSPTVPRAQAPKNKGSQSPEGANGGQKRSLFKQLINLTGGAFTVPTP